ncbi:tetratricopeptide repeat protein [[Clostridium] colinum]|uniref:tetratricopeptide repeat protein n=1 Tax=[Clostridium] colinum TaxID=36835 RepID=UPI0020240F5E|nr:tetratricopeptide repeat protein [[Clostridium] colinum]
MKGYIYSFLGNLYLIKYDTKRAIHCFEKALNYNTKNVLSIYNYGLILLQNGDFNKSLDLFLKAEKLNNEKAKKKSIIPSSANRTALLEKNIPLAIASSYWRLNQLDKAISILEDLRKKYDYVSPNTLTTLGYFYLLVKDYEKAKELSQLAIDDDANFYSAWDNMGQIYLELQDLDNAKKNFLKAIEINSKSVESLYYLGVISELEGNKDVALDYFKKALDCNITFFNTVSKESIEEKIKNIK